VTTNKFLTRIAGVLQQATAIGASAGVADANKIVATDATGRVHSSLMPSGIGADTSSLTATEAIPAGSYVNIWLNGGTPSIRLADNSNNRPANGFVLTAVANAATGTVYRTGRNTGDGSALGVRYLGTAGQSIAAASLPTAAGSIVQVLGVSDSSGVTFEFDEPILNG
jgi:hypothetical protein